ncbi:hypothetical protein HY404_02225 [Candidatus Microgenomates bacterium]|nr:hypothetical protein [Candidatus Microgenomates bacterium]
MKKTSQPRIVTFALLTTITMLTWVTFEVWHSFNKPAPIQVEQKLLAPLNPQLDTKTIEELRDKLFFEGGVNP